MDDRINELQKMIDESNYIVFFGGAGVSTESGIPDFRSKDGLYNMKYKYPPETMLSHSFFMSHTQDFFDFYRDKVIGYDAKPNITHLKLAEMEQAGKLKAVVTQNIDGLHQKAGSKAVYELHGSTLRNYCMNCHRFYSLDELKERGDVPKCDCGGVIKPDVVLYEEGLDDATIHGAINHIAKADMLIVGGTSLTVYPAAGFLDFFRGDRLVLINKGATSMDRKAKLLLNMGLGEVFSQLKV